MLAQGAACVSNMENIHREVQMHAMKPQIGSYQNHPENPFKVIYECHYKQSRMWSGVNNYA